MMAPWGGGPGVGWGALVRGLVAKEGAEQWGIWREAQVQRQQQRRRARGPAHGGAVESG